MKTIVRVHLRGRNPAKSAKPMEVVVGPDTYNNGEQCLYIKRHNNIWWRLSKRTPDGWHSVNVGFERVPQHQQLNQFLDNQ